MCVAAAAPLLDVCACVLQCRDEDREAFEDVRRYQYFNTNNLWIDLQALSAVYTREGVACRQTELAPWGRA